MAALICFSLLLSSLFIYINIRARNKYYIETSLYQFRQSKHELIMYMSENADTLDNKTFTELKDLLFLNNKMIENFSINHKMMFPIIKMVIANTILSGKKLDRNVIPQSHPIENIKKSFVMGFVYAFKAIPFINQRIIVFLVRFILNLLVLVGIKKFSALVNKLDLFTQTEDKFIKTNGCTF